MACLSTGNCSYSLPIITYNNTFGFHVDAWVIVSMSRHTRVRRNRTEEGAQGAVSVVIRVDVTP